MLKYYCRSDTAQFSQCIKVHVSHFVYGKGRRGLNSCIGGYGIWVISERDFLLLCAYLER